MKPRPFRPRLLASLLLLTAASLFFADAARRLDRASEWQQASADFSRHQEGVLQSLATTSEQHARLIAAYQQERLFLHLQDLPAHLASASGQAPGQWLTSAISAANTPPRLATEHRNTATWQRLELKIRMADAVDLPLHLEDWLQGTAARAERCRLETNGDGWLAACQLLWPRWQAS